MLVHVLNLGTHRAQMLNAFNLPEPEEKCGHFRSNKKVCNFFQIAYYFYSKWVYFKSTIALEHVWIKTKHYIHKSDEMKKTEEKENK